MLSKNHYFWFIIAFLLPWLFYNGVFFGRSFGLECAVGIMGWQPPYNQTATTSNAYCLNIADVGAYAWAHAPQWIKVANSYFNFKWPLWNQNNGIGVPLAANFISTAYFIPNILFAIPKSVFAFDLYFIFRMSIASLGMYLFLRSFKIPQLACLIGSFIVFLNGYVTYIPTISHLNVDILLPWIALLINKSFFTKKIKYFVLLSLITALSHLGGMPESSIFIALFFGVYVTYLSLIVAKRPERFKFITYFYLSLIFSLLIASILIIPGYEYIVNGSSYHHPGMPQAMYVDYRNLVFWSFPRLFGMLWESFSKFQSLLKFGISNIEYIGAVTFYFLLSSFLIIIIKWKKLKNFYLNKYYLFFIFFLLVLLLQYFGIFQNPIFTKLPGFNQTNFPKYSLTLINFLIATSVVFGIYYLIEKKNKIIPLLSASIMFIFAALTYSYFKNEAIDAGMYIHFVKQLIFSISLVLFLSFFLVFKDKLKIKKFIVYFLIFLLTMLEFYIYVPTRGDLKRRDSFRKPPAIDFLKSNDYKFSRIFSPDYFIYPNLSAIFDINDARNLDAIWPKYYYNYIKYFVVPEMDKGGMRFTGLIENGTTIDAKYVDNIYFDLLSVKYILSNQDINAYEDSRKIKFFDDQIEKSPSLRNDIFEINGISKPVLFEHPPAKILLKIRKPLDAKYLYLYPGLSSQVFDDTDGVGFKATIVNNSIELFKKSVEIKPKNNLNDQKWFEMKLGPFREGIISFDLILETDPLITSASDWAGWGGFEWDTEKYLPKQYQFTKIYDNEMKIYENKNFIPRLHPIKTVLCAENEDSAIKKMQELIDIMKDIGIVLSRDCIPKNFSTDNISITNQSFEDQKVSFTYSSLHDSYVVLSNLYYPGWKLKINGETKTIDRVNYTFQGLRLPKDENAKVEVVYDPLSFKLGLSITSISTLICFFILFLKKRKSI